MNPLDKIPGVDADEGPSEHSTDADIPLDWADEDRKIEDRKPDLGETEEDTSEL
jgi:hypothetical protein